MSNIQNGPNILNGVAPFRTSIFRSRAEFEIYLGQSDAERGLRWLHERSMASNERSVDLPGVCGLCLVPATFSSSTRGGETVPAGRVPNWREEMVCDCEYRLNNRQRALLHHVAAEGFVQPWTRILLLSASPALRPMLAAASPRVIHDSRALEVVASYLKPPAGGFHLILSEEQLGARHLRGDVVASLRELLAPGGIFAATAPFDVNSDQDGGEMHGPINWRILTTMKDSGFSDVKVCNYWSEELGYLGPFNMILSATRP